MTNQLAEGMRAGLVRVSFTAKTEPRHYLLTISNGSGIKRTTVTTSAYSTAWAWGEQWAATEGAGWQVLSAERVGA